MAPLLKFLFRSDFVAPCAMGDWHNGMSFSPFSRSAALDDKVNAGTKRRNIDQIFKQAASRNSFYGAQLGYPLVDRFIR